MNKKEMLFELVNNDAKPNYVPAAFFLHFGEAYHQGQSAINRQLEFFRATGMDMVKIQYEQQIAKTPFIKKPEDWVNAPRYDEAYFAPTIQVVEGLVKEVGKEAPVILTIYSPFMLAAHMISPAELHEQFKQNPEAVKKGLDILTENVITLMRACKRAGIDGFYVSSQGGEAFRFGGTDIFSKYIKPTDLAIWSEIEDRSLNILHVCDYNGGYDDLTPFPDYPGHVVNVSLKVGDQSLSPKQMAEMFKRPFMGGMERKGVLAAGSAEMIRQAASDILSAAPDRFILAADCTVPNDTAWENLKIAIDTAHQFRT